MSTKQTGTTIVTLVIDNLSKLDKLATYQEKCWSFGGVSYFGIYPRLTLPGHTNENVHVYWYNVSGLSKKVHFKVSILSESDSEKLYTQEYSWQFDGTYSVAVVAFIQRDKLFDSKNDYLVNDKLTLLCEAETIDKSSNDFSSITQQESMHLSGDFESLLTCGKFTDTILTIGSDGKQFHVHKAILAARSPVFAAMFEHDCAEKHQNEVKIVDIDPETCAVLLRYINTGKVNQMDRYALELLQAADKYQFSSLKNICENFLCSNLSIEMASNALLVADLHQSTKLKHKCLEYFCANINRVRETDGWKELEDTNAKLHHELLLYLESKNK